MKQLSQITTTVTLGYTCVVIKAWLFLTKFKPMWMSAICAFSSLTINPVHFTMERGEMLTEGLLQCAVFPWRSNFKIYFRKLPSIHHLQTEHLLCKSYFHLNSLQFHLESNLYQVDPRAPGLAWPVVTGMKLL